MVWATQETFGDGSQFQFGKLRVTHTKDLCTTNLSVLHQNKRLQNFLPTEPNGSTYLYSHWLSEVQEKSYFKEQCDKKIFRQKNQRALGICFCEEGIKG